MQVLEVSTEALWHQYKDQGSRSAKTLLTVKYLPLVRKVVNRFIARIPNYIDRDDLISYGVIGLIGAVEKFEPNKQVKFETYASTRVRGSIIDELRQLDWAPRSLRRMGRRVQEERGRLEATLMRRPEQSELAEALGITVKSLDKTLSDISNSYLVTLNSTKMVAETDGLTLIDLLEDSGAQRPDRVLDSFEARKAVSNAVRALPERERVVVSMYYYGQSSLREIGDHLHVTESRVSQLHTAAVAKLRKTFIGTAPEELRQLVSY